LNKIIGAASEDTEVVSLVRVRKIKKIKETKSLFGVGANLTTDSSKAPLGVGTREKGSFVLTQKNKYVLPVPD